MASKQKRLSLKDKFDILEFWVAIQIWVFVVLADKFSVRKTQILDIIDSKDALYKTLAENGEKNRK